MKNVRMVVYLVGQTFVTLQIYQSLILDVRLSTILTTKSKGKWQQLSKNLLILTQF